MKSKFSLSQESLRILSSAEPQSVGTITTESLSAELLNLMNQLSQNLSSKVNNQSELSWHIRYEIINKDAAQEAYCYHLELGDKKRALIDLIVQVNGDGHIEFDGGLIDPATINQLSESIGANHGLIRQTKDIAINSLYRLKSKIRMTQEKNSSLISKIKELLQDIETFFVAILDTLPAKNIATI